MALNTLNAIATSFRQKIIFRKTSTANVASAVWHSSTAGLGGLPAQMSAVGNTANGLVPVAGDTGFPEIQPTSGTVKLIGVEVSNDSTVGGRILVYDRLFHAGAYTMNTANTTLASQPSYSGRCPDYSEALLYLECISTLGISTSATLTIGYTNQAGTSGRSTAYTVYSTGTSTGTYAFIKAPMQAGDIGVQSVDSIVGSGTMGNTVNLVVARPLFYGTFAPLEPIYYPLDTLSAPTLYSTSALGIAFAVDGAARSLSGTEVVLELASG